MNVSVNGTCMKILFLLPDRNVGQLLVFDHLDPIQEFHRVALLNGFLAIQPIDHCPL